MTEPSPAIKRRLELLRGRRASAAADRAAFEERRRHGLTARHQAKLAHLARRDDPTDEPDNKEEPTPNDIDNDAA